MDKPKLLCIDDDPNIGAAVARDLRDLFDVYTVADFEEAKKIMSDAFYIVVCDYNLDDTNGLHVLNWIQKKYPSTIRILMTGMTETESLEEMIADNLLHKFILKPWEKDLLRLHMIEALGVRKLLTERDKFKELSITDPVTELTNHRFFQEKLRLETAKSIKHKMPISLIMLDVDHFKLLNDQYGHPVGDEVLNLLAKDMNQHMKPQYSLSRYGGEEFTVVMPGTTSAQAYQLAETLRESVLQMPGLNFRVSVSLGISSYPEHGLDADELIAAADQALYCAKRQGRNMSVVGSDI